jgi:hypothetical protein
MTTPSLDLHQQSQAIKQLDMYSRQNLVGSQYYIDLKHLETRAVTAMLIQLFNKILIPG